MIWDVFCRVIDNHGDLGVSWRLGCQLASLGHRVRLWVDNPSDLDWMAPNGKPGLELKVWTSPLRLDGLEPGDVLIETFGCEVATEFIAAYRFWLEARGRKCLWINLEYLSAQPYVERSHCLPSPILQGAGEGLVKYFFYPGFTGKTGGLLREPDLHARQTSFDRNAWLTGQGILVGSERLVSIFCYEPAGLASFIERLETSESPTRLLVCAGRANQAVKKAMLSSKNSLKSSGNGSSLVITYLPYLSQDDFDHLLWSCDLNLVRGEDSLVRAIWAGKAWGWQIYPQEDGAHQDKLERLLDVLDATDSMKRFHRGWNALSEEPVTDLDLGEWAEFARKTRGKLLEQLDLASKLLTFVKTIEQAGSLNPKKS